MKSNAAPDEQEDLSRFEGEGGHDVTELNLKLSPPNEAFSKRRRRLNGVAAGSGDGQPAANKPK